MVVPTGNAFSLAEVTEVHNELRIRPNDEIEYKYVAAKVDFGPYDELLAVNDKLRDTLSRAYQENIRRQFRDQFLANLEADKQREVLALLGNSATTKE